MPATTSDARHGYREFGFGTLLAAAVLAATIWSGLPVQLWSDTVRAIERLSTLMDHPAPVTATPAARAFNLTGNPFLQFAGEAGFRFHPLIGIAGTTWNTKAPYFAERDYFGFRNDVSAYFDPTPHRSVVITGNSEMVGVTHAVTIAKKLEAILRRRTGESFRVVNMAMNSATTAQEINYFVNLGFNLHPEFVISHSLATDGYYGSAVPDELQVLGLFPLPFEVNWARSIHGNSVEPRAFDGFAPLNRRFLREGIVKNVQRYQAIAQASGAHFIWGIQKVEWRNVTGTPAEAPYRLTDEVYREMAAAKFPGLAGVDLVDFNAMSGLTMYGPRDPIHTDEVTSRRIAEIYADKIIARLASRNRKDRPGEPAAETAAATPGAATTGNRTEDTIRRIVKLAELTAGNKALTDIAVSAVGFRPAPSILGNVDMFRALDHGQHEIAGWALDTADVNRPTPFIIAALNNGAVVLARESADNRPDVAASYKSDIASGQLMGFSGTMYCEAGTPVSFFAIMPNGTLHAFPVADCP